MSDKFYQGALVLVRQAGNILTSPSKGWGRIDAELPTIFQTLGYAAILSIIPAFKHAYDLNGYVTWSVFGITWDYFQDLIRFVATCAAGNAIARIFGGTVDSSSSYTLAAYSMTPVWLAGVYSLMSAYSNHFVALATTLYAIFLFHQGAQSLMKMSAGKATAFTIAVVAIYALMFLVIFYIEALFLRLPYAFHR